MSGSAVVDIRGSYGVAFIGLIFSTFLNGVTITQTWIYYRQYHGRDPKAVRVFIAILIILDTVHTILCCHGVYWYLVLNFGNADILATSVWSINTQVCVNGTIGFLVQLFYARRVYALSKSVVIPILIAILGAITCTFTFVFTIRSSALVQFSRIATLKWVASINLSVGAAADIIIAGAMCWYLYNKRTGFARTDSLIVTLMTYSINSGLLTSILGICALGTFAVNPAKYFHVADALFWLMGKCYVNSFLAMLNNRDNIQAQCSNATPSKTFQLDSVHSKRKSHKSKTGPTSVSVTVHRTATTDFATADHSFDKEEDLDKQEGTFLSSLHHESPTSVSGV